MIQTLIRYKSIPKEQLFHDLQWLISSSALVSSELPDFKGELLQNVFQLLDEGECEKWFKDLADDSANIYAYFNSDEQLILGKYFERLLSYFFENYPQFELIHAGKQLFKGQETEGEIDFVVRDKKEGKIYHLEVAVKYYMGYKDVGKHDLWIGPNGSDTLQKKIRKLEKQLDLSDRLEEKIDFKMALMLGYLFKRWKGANWPYFANHINYDACWIYENEVVDFFEQTSKYVIVPKSKWLAFYLGENLDLHFGEAIIPLIRDQIQLIEKGIMVAKVDDKTMRCVQLCIVVPLRWPRL